MTLEQAIERADIAGVEAGFQRSSQWSTTRDYAYSVWTKADESYLLQVIGSSLAVHKFERWIELK